MSRRIMIWLALAVMTLALVGCGGGTTVKTDDGSVTVGNDMTWPTASVGGLAAPGGKVTGIVKANNGDGVVVAIDQLGKSEAEAYAAKLQAAGYTSEYEMKDATTYMFAGTKADGSAVIFTYDYEDGQASLTYTPVQSGSTPGTSDPNGGTTEQPGEAVDMTDAVPWPTGYLAGVPELAGKITNVVELNGTEVTVELSYVVRTDFEAFIQQIKDNGFGFDADEIKDAYERTYSAKDKDGNYLMAHMNYEYQTVTVYMEKAS